MQRLSRAGDVAGDAVANLEPDRADVVALGDARDELLARLVEEIQRGAIGLERLGDLVENELEQLVEIERRTERGAHLAQRLADTHLARQARLELGQAGKPRVERSSGVAARGHGPILSGRARLLGAGPQKTNQARGAGAPKDKPGGWGYAVQFAAERGFR